VYNSHVDRLWRVDVDIRGHTACIACFIAPDADGGS